MKVPFHKPDLPLDLFKQKMIRFYKFCDRFTAPKTHSKPKLFPPLDVDEEGHPTHHPGSNREGITTW